MKRAVQLLALALTLALSPPSALAGGEKLDPKRIINESNSFLKEREPVMTEEEYALYDKVVSMMSTNPQFAVKLLEAMLNDKEPPSPAFEFILGNAYYAAGELDKSETRYRSAVKRYPSFLRAWINLGALYYSAERYAEAIPCFSKAVTLGDREAATFGMLGYCLEKSGNLISAEMAYMQALSGDPTSPDWQEGLMRICIEGKQYSRAESMVKSIIRERPTEVQFWLVYANILISEGRKLDATILLETSVGMRVANTEELTLLGDLYADQGLVPEAAESYRKVIAASPEIGEPKLLRFAEVLVSDGRLSDAQDVLAGLGSKVSASGRVEYMQAKADLLSAQKRWPETIVELSDLLNVAPLNGRALLSLGRAYLAVGDAPRASFAFESATQVPASAYAAYLELANIELRSRHYSKTVDYLEKADTIQRSDAVEDYLTRIKTLAARDDPQQQ